MATEVILLERIENLGQMGETVKVKPGYARNYLLPEKKALRATKDNIAYFETMRKTLEAQNLKKKQEAEKVAKTIDGLKVVIIRQAAEGGQLYGSVASRDIVEAVTEAGVKIERHQIQLNQNFKMIGLFPVDVALHPEVKVQVTINIARSEDEAAVQEKTGKALVADDNAPVPAMVEAEEQAEAAKAELLEEDALQAEKERAEEEAAAAAEAEEKAKEKAEKKAAKEAAKAAEEAAADAETSDETNTPDEEKETVES